MSGRQLLRRAGPFGASFTLGPAAAAPAAAASGRGFGDRDPCADTWFYSNLIFIDVAGVR